MNSLNVLEEVSSSVNSPRFKFYEAEQTYNLPFAFLPRQERRLNERRRVSREDPFLNPEDGLRMDGLGARREARGEPTAEAGRGELLERTHTAKTFLLHKVNKLCNLLLV